MLDIQKNKTVFKRFLTYVKPYWFLIFIATIGGVIKFTVPLVFPQIMRYFIDVVLNTGNALAMSRRIYLINFWSLFVVGLYLFIWVPGTYIRHYFAGKAGHRVIFDLRYQLFLHIQRMSASYFNENQSGGIVSRLINDIALAQNMVGNALSNIWMDGAVIIVLLVVMLRIDWLLTLVSLCVFPIYIIATKKLGKLVKDNSRAVQNEIAEMTGNLQEKISGFSVVQAYTREKYEELQFFRESRKLLEYTLRSAKLSSINLVIVGFLTSIAPIFIVWFSANRILNGYMTAGEMVVFYSYLGQFYFPINRFSELNVIFATSLAAIERVFEVFDRDPDVQEKPDAVECGQVKGHIEFHDVSFGYTEEDQVLKQVNLEILPGQKVAIVGSSGSGKSTMINLLPRFYDPRSGHIRVDGVDLRDYKLKSLRQNIGMVLQETILFSGTLGDNISYGNPKADEKDIIKAAKAGNAWEFIEKLPEKMDTEVGERGVKLSGGQKQRIAITRAFLKDPSILILDEATSALDSEAENIIQEALERLMNNRTTIIIAHRLSTIISADIILVMDEGEIKEKGTHDELLAQGGIYKHLFDEQFKDVKELLS